MHLYKNRNGRKRKFKIEETIGIPLLFFIKLCNSAYIKVCVGVLPRRSSGLGLALLFSLLFLFLSPLSILLPPSPTSLRLSLLLPPLSLSLALGCVLVKLMVLLDNKLQAGHSTDRGVERAGINQAVTVFFIVFGQVRRRYNFIYDLCYIEPGDMGVNLILRKNEKI